MSEKPIIVTEFPFVFGTMQQDAIDETHLEAQRAKAEAEATRAFVLERVAELRGKTMPVEIDSVVNLTTHNCLIINDHLLLSYREAKELIEKLEFEGE